MTKKIPVGIIGATGSVGQKFIELLSPHPWFEIVALGASERSQGKLYHEIVPWIGSHSVNSPEMNEVGQLPLQKCSPSFPCKIIFSGLDSSVAGEIETQFAEAGYIVISNARNHRFAPDVPLMIPEVNPEHLALIHQQKHSPGAIITNPNCSTTGLALGLKPLFDRFGIDDIHVVTLQALSGAGYPGVPSIDILDNVIPYISGEEEKIETEPKKILGSYKENKIELATLKISAQCNRVHVSDGHLECVSLRLKEPADLEEIKSTWNNFRGVPQKIPLPSAPNQPIYYFEEPNFPQPRFHRNLEKGMSVSIGRLKQCSLFDIKFVLLSHNTVRGAAGGAILNAELLVQENSSLRGS